MAAKLRRRHVAAPKHNPSTPRLPFARRTSPDAPVAAPTRGARSQLSAAAGPLTAIWEGIETFETVADIQRAMRARVSGIRSSSEWCRQLRSRHGAKVRDASGKVVANVSYNARMWRPSGGREEMVVE